MRCQKSKMVCPGYRDKFDVKFRDETKSIKRKASERQVQQPSSSSGDDIVDEGYSKNSVMLHSTTSSTLSPDFIRYSSSSPTRSHGSSKHSPHSSISSITSITHFAERRLSDEDQVLPIVQHLSTPIDQQATCFFLSNFVLTPPEGTMRGFFDFLIPILKRPTPEQSFVLAFVAVGFAALGARPNSKSLLPKADYFYVKALKHINVALQHPKRSMDDSILAAVLLLSIFEVSITLTHI